MNVHFGTFGDLRFQGTSQVPDIPLRAVIATAEHGKRLVELLLRIHRTVQPERADSPIQLANPFHLGSTQPTVQHCGQNRKEPLGTVLHLRDQALTQGIATLAQYISELYLRDDSRSLLLLKQSFRVPNRQRFIDKTEIPTQIVLPEMSQQHVGLPGPRPIDTVQGKETLSTGLLVQLFVDPQPGVATSVKCIV